MQKKIFSLVLAVAIILTTLFTALANDEPFPPPPHGPDSDPPIVMEI